MPRWFWHLQIPSTTCLLTASSCFLVVNGSYQEWKATLLCTRDLTWKASEDLPLWHNLYCSNIVTTTQFYSPFSSRHWSRGDNTKLPSWAFNWHMKLRPNTWTPLSPKPAHLAHSDSELLFSSLYLTLLSFSHPHFILPHTLSTIFHRTYARSTHSQNLKEKHSSTYFHTHAHAPDI